MHAEPQQALLGQFLIRKRMLRLFLGKVKSQGTMSQLTAEAEITKMFNHEEGMVTAGQLHGTGRQDLWVPVSDTFRRKWKCGHPRDAELVTMGYLKTSKQTSLVSSVQSRLQNSQLGSR